MSAQEDGELTPREREAVQDILRRIATLARFLADSPVPEEPNADVLYTYLARIKEIQGNTDHGVSLVACLLAKQWLCAHLEMAPFDVAAKPQGARGLDIDERTVSGQRVVGEVKTTVPYGEKDLGSQQRTSFEKDFAKLNAADAPHRFFFVTERRTFELLRGKYRSRIPGVTVVLLPEGEDSVCRRGDAR